MRVLHVIDSLRAGGKERQLIELLKGLQQETDVACEVVLMSDIVEYEAFGRLGVRSHVLLRKARYDPSMFWRLHRVIKAFRPDMLHSWNSMCSVYAAPLAKLAGIKFVDGFVRGAPAKLTCRDPDYFRGKLTSPLSDAVVSNSAAGLAAYRISASKGVCIHNGFDPARIARLLPPEDVRRSLGIDTGHIVGMVATFSRLKDHATFFQAARQVTALRGDVTFLALGDGETQAEFRRALPADLHPRIRFTGRRADVESIVNLFTVGVLTTNAVHGEGIANAIMEYMALGKPVVATDCGGNTELVEEDRTGYLIGNADADALVNRISRLLDDPALAHAFGERGRARIGEEFSLERMTHAYVNLYRGILATRRTDAQSVQPL